MPTRRHVLARGLLTLLSLKLGGATQAAPGTKPLVLGIVPNLSPRSLLTVYQPLRTKLEVFLSRPVNLFTAPDFFHFYNRTLAGEYDVALMPAHLGRLAQLEGGLVPLVKFLPGQFGFIVVRKGGKVERAADLRGKRIALVDPIALVTLRGEDWLKTENVAIQPRTQAVRHYVYHNAAVEAVINDQADAAIVSSGPFNTMPQELRDKVRILENIGEMPANFFMGHPRLQEEGIAEVRRVLLDFGRQPGELASFFQRYRYNNIVPLEAAELHPLDYYALRARDVMQAMARLRVAAGAAAARD